MARPVVWTGPAADDLEAIVEFVARDSDAYARTLAQLIVTAAESLQQFPHRGHRLRDPKLARFRELLVGSYRVVYLVQRQRILIVGVLHGHRALERALRGRGRG